MIYHHPDYLYDIDIMSNQDEIFFLKKNIIICPHLIFLFESMIYLNNYQVLDSIL